MATEADWSLLYYSRMHNDVDIRSTKQRLCMLIQSISPTKSEKQILWIYDKELWLLKCNRTWKNSYWLIIIQKYSIVWQLANHLGYLLNSCHLLNSYHSLQTLNSSKQFFFFYHLGCLLRNLWLLKLKKQFKNICYQRIKSRR